jgi:hypothetical protein
MATEFKGQKAATREAAAAAVFGADDSNNIGLFSRNKECGTPWSGRR